MIIETRSPEETFQFGEKLGREAKPGQIYTLNGDLGTGKTVFTQGFADRAWHYRAGKQPDFYDRTDLRRRTHALLSF